MKCQIIFSKKNMKNVISLLSAEFFHSVVRNNTKGKSQVTLIWTGNQSSFNSLMPSIPTKRTFANSADPDQILGGSCNRVQKVVECSSFVCVCVCACVCVFEGGGYVCIFCFATVVLFSYFSISCSSSLLPLPTLFSLCKMTHKGWRAVKPQHSQDQNP